MYHLFSPLSIGSLTLRNRIVRAPLPIGMVAPGGFATTALLNHYRGWASGGVGLIISEPLFVHPVSEVGCAGLYDDLLIPEVARIAQALAEHDTPLLALLSHAPLAADALQIHSLEPLNALFVAAAWRAYAAGCRGVMLDGANHMLLHQLHSPLTNQRRDAYGGLGRLRFAAAVIEAIRRWLGPHFVIGYRLVVDELRPDGITLQESRVAAHQLVAAGAHLLDIVVGMESTQPIAYFPGWQTPLAAAIRAVVDVPIIANGSLGDPELAESVLAEGSADLIGLSQTLVAQPAWPHHAAQVLAAEANSAV